MRSTLSTTERIDLSRYLDEYFQRPDAIRAMPGDAELVALAHKAIVREQLVLVSLPEGEAAREGDTAVIRTASALPKFNKEKVTVTLGRGLYNKDLETALIGKKVGESVTLAIQDAPVSAIILDLKRKQVPAPTDEMVKELQVKDDKGHLIETVSAYEAYIREQKTMETLANINFYTVSEILKAYPVAEYDEEDIRVLGELEREFFIRIFKEQEGIDISQDPPAKWKEDMGVNSLEEFIAKRREWYQMKIQQCLIFLNILGLPAEGKTDPLDHYEVLSELQMKIFDLIKEELTRRNAR